MTTLSAIQMNKLKYLQQYDPALKQVKAKYLSLHDGETQDQASINNATFALDFMIYVNKKCQNQLNFLIKHNQALLVDILDQLTAPNDTKTDLQSFFNIFQEFSHGQNMHANLDVLDSNYATLSHKIDVAVFTTYLVTLGLIVGLVFIYPITIVIPMVIGVLLMWNAKNYQKNLDHKRSEIHSIQEELKEVQSLILKSESEREWTIPNESNAKKFTKQVERKIRVSELQSNFFKQSFANSQHTLSQEVLDECRQAVNQS